MSRKSSSEAHKDYLQRDFDRWRLLARNHVFREDLCAYLKGCGKGVFRDLRSSRLAKRVQRMRQLHLQKWGIITPPDAELWPDADYTITPDRLERWYQRQREEEKAFITCLPPVFMNRIRAGEYPSRLFVEFDIDTSLPVDLILGLLDKQLRDWYWKEFGPHDRGKPASIDLQLKVYDLVCGSEEEKRRTFPEVASALSKQVSTIRDAYFAARTKIGIAETAKRSLSSRSLVNPGPVKECRDDRCRNAVGANDFCKAHQTYFNQDYGSQKDFLR